MIQQKWHLFVLLPEKPGHQEAELCDAVMQLPLTSPHRGKADLQSDQRCTGVSPCLAQYISNLQILCRCKL